MRLAHGRVTRVVAEGVAVADDGEGSVRKVLASMSILPNTIPIP